MRRGYWLWRWFLKDLFGPRFGGKNYGPSRCAQRWSYLRGGLDKGPNHPCTEWGNCVCSLSHSESIMHHLSLWGSLWYLEVGGFLRDLFWFTSGWCEWHFTQNCKYHEGMLLWCGRCGISGIMLWRTKGVKTGWVGGWVSGFLDETERRWESRRLLPASGRKIEHSWVPLRPDIVAAREICTGSYGTSCIVRDRDSVVITFHITFSNRCF